MENDPAVRTSTPGKATVTDGRDAALAGERFIPQTNSLFTSHCPPHTSRQPKAKIALCTTVVIAAACSSVR
jgi:hypothetical protein